MGGSSSQEKIKKKVVIIGGSFAGIAVASYLWDSMELLMIDKNDYFEYICNWPRATAR